jgi:uncharacterized protein YndB with AHSA1/START domain
MSKPKFVYVTYIAATPEKVWEALTSKDISARYWFGYNVNSDWTLNSSFALKDSEGRTMDDGVILESDPPHRLSYSWHPQYADFSHERPSRVTFVIEQLTGQVRLTITHEDFDEGSKVFESISGGWPMVLSSLKTFLESGQGLPPSWTETHKQVIASVEARA